MVYVGRSTVEARTTFTAGGPDELVKIFRIVIYGEFLPALYIAHCKNHDAPRVCRRFSVRLARMIDVACGVGDRRAVDSPFFVYLEEIARCHRVGELRRYLVARIFENKYPFLHIAQCKEAQARSGL